jgi:hypothetical protein
MKVFCKDSRFFLFLPRTAEKCKKSRLFIAETQSV